MKKAIVFALSLLTSTIVPSIVLNDAVFAETPMTQKSAVELNQCALSEFKMASPKALEPTKTSGTAIDLQLVGTQKVNLACFFGTGEGVKTPEPLVAKPDRFRLEIRYNPEEKRLEVPLFNISF